MKTEKQQEKAAPKKFVAYSTVIVAAIAIFAYYAFSSSVHSASAVSSLITGNTGIMHFATGLSYLANSSKGLNVSYTGNLILTIYTPNQNGTQQEVTGNIPVRISYMKLGNYSRLNISTSIIENSQYFNSSTLIMAEPNGTYVCPSSNFAAPMACQRANQSNVSAIISSYVKNAYSSVHFDGIRSYGGNSCTMVNGQESAALNASRLIDQKALQQAEIIPSFKSATLAGTFSSCISNHYFVPLNLTAYNLVSFQIEDMNLSIQENVTLGVILNEVSINGKASISQITH